MKSISTVVMSGLTLVFLYASKRLFLEKIVKSTLILFIKIHLQGWVNNVANIFNSIAIPKLFLRSAFVLLFLLVTFWGNAQTIITNGNTVPASTILANNTITIDAGGTLNMDVARTFASITTVNAGTSTISGTNTLTVTGAITIVSSNSLSLNPACTSGSLTTNWTTTTAAVISGTGVLTTGAVTVDGGKGNGNDGNLTIGNTVICTSLSKNNGNKFHNIRVSGIFKISGTITSINNFICDIGSIVEYNGAAQTIFSTTYSSLTLSGSLTKTAGGDITIGGALTLNNSAGMFSLGSNLLTIDGTVTQTFGTITTAPGSSLSFGTNAASLTLPNGLFTAAPIITNLTINRVGGVVLGNQGIALTGTLTLTSGIITTGTNTVTVGVNAAGIINGGSATSYIEGKLAREITSITPTTFPIGKGGNYRPVIFTYASAPLTKIVTMEQFETAIPGTIPSNISIARFGSRYRTITQSSLGINYSVGLNNGGITPTGTAVMLRGEGGTITSNTTTFSTPNYTNSTPFTAISASNDFALGETNIPLTITGVTVNNRPYDGTVVATLITASAALSGVVGLDAVTLNSGSATGTFADKNVGVGKTVTTAGFTISGTNSTAYTLGQPTTTATIAAKGLTITANNQSKNYGTTFIFAGTEFTSSGLVNGDVLSSVTFTSSGAASTATVAGSPYTIVPSAATGTGLSNYSISYVNGILSVSSANQAIADFRTKASGNFSVPATWEYNPDGNWITATLAPVSTSNINILAGHIIALDQNFTVGAGKTFLISSGGSLNITPNITLDVVLGGTLNFNGQSVTVKSTSVGTGSIGVISGTLSGATNVTTERYIGTNKRAWRLLTIPVTGHTIRDAWAGVVPNANAFTNPETPSTGYGTIITGNGTPGSLTPGNDATAAGFDWFSNLPGNAASSIRSYNSVTSSWAYTNTPSPYSTTFNQGYMLYIRGDRTVADATSSGTTTLRPNGTLKVGQVTVSVPDALTLVGNPYLSSIDLDAMYKNSGNNGIITQTFYVWDATLGSSGAFRTISWDGVSQYFMTGGSGNALDYLIVNSGQAFFVTKNGGGSLNIAEANKTSTAPQTMFRPIGTADKISSIQIKLYQATGNQLGQVNDGVVARYNNIYNAAPTDIYDAAKLNNFNENLSLVRNNKYLSIESRPYPTQKDTLFVPFWNLKVRDYALTISSSQFADLNQTARLIDKFTQTEKPIDLTDKITTYPFTITSDAASSSLSRFMIVMTPATVLPVTFTNIKANLIGINKVQVTWSTGSELSVKDYDVEKSIDGSNYSKTGTVVSMNSATVASYQWLDDQPVKGNNFYRIRSNDVNGKYVYSNIAVIQVNGKKGIQVAPTTINNQQFTLSLNDQPVGKYSLLLTNSIGQRVFEKSITNSGGYNTQQVVFGNIFMAAGVYHLSVSDSNGRKQNFKLIINK